ncbi:type II toxin-antitoxin system VapC family toxin [Nocardia sp. NPDC006044]|uniref:type II toxin-antitoxin system VapC family toxin n=1 Tax=Nocardia sp. NPDC006044 TaxID=3364306 RepID=UPI00367BDC0F
MFLLDTNVVSELRKAGSGKVDENVYAWAADHPVAGMFVSAITVQELEIGVLRVERRDRAQGVVLRKWLESQVLPSFAERILPVDVAVARRSAKLHVPDSRPVRDALIAATALVHGMTVATRNVRDFAPTGVAVFDPWMPAEPA